MFHMDQVQEVMFIRRAQSLMVINCSIQKQLVSRKSIWLKIVLIRENVLNWLKSLVSRPAPHFEGTAVINGEFTQLSLSDYLGKYVVFFFYPLDL